MASSASVAASTCSTVTPGAVSRRVARPSGKPITASSVTTRSTGRSEVSGTRLWGWARDRFGTPERFFARFFVGNYCPLCFVDEGGRNITPDKLGASEREPLLEACDEALRQVTQYLRPRWVVGIGGFAQKQAERALAGMDVRIGTILHPSPASPLANRGWATEAEKQLRALGIELPTGP